MPLLREIQSSGAPIAVATGVLAVFLFAAYLVHTYRKLKDFPGPFWAKFTDAQRSWWVKSMRAHEIHQEQHEKYGDAVRFGPNMISLSDPAAIPALYPMRAGFPKSLFYRGIMPYVKGGALPAIFTTQDEHQHKVLKTPVASLYSLSNVVTFEPFVNQVLDQLFEQLDARFVKTGATFDLSEWAGFFAWEVMALMTFSKTYGFLEKGADTNGLLTAVWDFMLKIAPMTQFPMLDRILYKSWVSDVLKNHVAVPILKIVADNVAEREGGGALEEKKEKEVESAKGDFLSHFMRIQAEDPKVPAWACKVWTFSNVIAGSDSTTSIMKATLYNLLANKSTLDKLRNEFAEADKVTPFKRPYPTWNEVKGLEYLDACVLEAVRMHPPFVLPLERVVPKGGVVINGRHYEEGTCIGMNAYVVNRHKPTFGEDAEYWRPERWLVEDPALRRKLEGSIMTFGAGRRTCIGRHIAILEVKKLISALVVNYDFELVDAKSYFRESSYFFRQEGVNVKIQRRQF